ncbi:MarR family winged helix-turn-helix transcriptional regulator [Mycetocola zhujimingii]|uniref:MarR family winged helix-turn-helix transcriptional regulator n=1 Tax=Mycetocola zhujimingii TaxID=2079792 RepID=UPI000D38F8AE|nr:MarR family transcriptional regulator [Mycetocola zhujimingii]AWB85659.1 hypothetical protein C3E77_02820 [Mycetocola zhujimingii]
MALPDTNARFELTSTRDLALGLRDLVLNGLAFQQVRAAHLGLSPTDLTALEHVYLAGPLTPGDLATRLGLTSGSITPLVDRIQAGGYLLRDVNPDDRRSSLVKTTPAGESAMKQFFEEVDAVVRDALDEAPGIANTTMNDAFQKTAHALKAHTAK